MSMTPHSSMSRLSLLLSLTGHFRDDQIDWDASNASNNNKATPYRVDAIGDTYDVSYTMWTWAAE